MSQNPVVRLLPVDDDVLERLLATAVRDAEPAEVMPPVAGPAGWTAERQDAFRAFHRERRDGLAGDAHEITFAVAADGQIVGSARLERKTPSVLEAGLWLGRSARGHGIGTTVMPILIEEASKAGAVTVVAETTTVNLAARGVLGHSGGRLSVEQGAGRVRAEIHLARPGA